MPRIGIIGAGITGLSLAWYLQKFHPNCSITLYEKEKKSGGVIATAYDPFFFEKGPRTFSGARCPNLLSLIDEVGLKEELLFSSSGMKRWIYDRGKLRPPLPFALGVKVLAKDLFLPHKSHREDLSIAQFFSERYGELFATRCIDPLISGIYADDIDSLSLETAFPRIWEIQRTHRSLVWGTLRSPKKRNSKKGLFTLKKGLSSLIEKLTSFFEIQYEQQVLIRDSKIITNHSQIEYDHIFVTCSPEGLFGDDVPLIPMTHNPLVVVSCGYHSQPFHKKGFGYLVPSHQKEQVLGCVFDSMIFPEQDHQAGELRLTYMLGGMHQREMIHKPDDDLIDLVNKALLNHLKLPPPNIAFVHRYPRAIPHYPIGFQKIKGKWLSEMKITHPHVTFLGTFLGDPAVNARVAMAKKCAEMPLNFFRQYIEQQNTSD